jgi:hypothetical protein
MLNTIINAWSAFKLTQYATWVFTNLFFVKRVYQSAGMSTDKKTAEEVIHALNQIPNAFRLGVEVWHHHMVPALLISREVIAFSKIETAGFHCEKHVSITVYRPRFGKIAGMPLVPDKEPPPLPTKNKGIIRVLEKSSNRDNDEDLTESIERAVPLRGIDHLILSKATSVAEQIFKEFREGHGSARVYVLHGPPGCGKTTTARLLTQMLRGILYPSYDPTSVVSYRSIVNVWAKSDSPIVIAYDEFDVTFEKIASGELVKPRDYDPDALNKVSWNRTLDRFNSKVNAIMLLITNKSLEEIQAICNKTCKSLLRQGRVEAHFVWPEGPGQDPIKIPAWVYTTTTATTSEETYSYSDSDYEFRT